LGDSLGIVIDFGQSVFQIVEDAVGLDEDDEEPAEKEADEDVAPEGAEAEAQTVEDDVTAEDGDVAVAAGEPDVPAVEGLDGDDGGVDGGDGAGGPAEEIEEVDVGLGGAGLLLIRVRSAIISAAASAAR
jgi:hypothetical protein